MGKLHITSLLRTHNGSVSNKAIESAEELPETSLAPSPATSRVTGKKHPEKRGEAATNVEVEFLPTLNFLFEERPRKATVEEAESQFTEEVQHAASSADGEANYAYDFDNDNDSTHTYIISRSSLTAATSRSSSTQYAVTSTDTEELLRRQNNLSLTEEDQTVSSFSIEPPTSSMTIEMAEQHTTATTATATATSCAEMAGATTTTTMTTTSSSIEEDIEEAIEISEVEEQLSSHVESLSGPAAYRRPKEQPGAKSLSSSNDDEEEGDAGANAEQFRIDDSQLSGGKLAQHFLTLNDESEADNVRHDGSKVEVSLCSSNYDDLDISLPLGQSNLMHSRHEDEDEDEPDIVDQSLSNQSTTDDVSELAEEPVQSRGEQRSEAIMSASDAPETQVDEEPQLTEEKDHSMEEIVASNESIEVTYEADETANTSHKVDQITDLDEEQGQEASQTQDETVQNAVTPTAKVETLMLPMLKEPVVMENKDAKALAPLFLQPEPLKLTMLEVDCDDGEDDDEESSLQLMKLRLMAMNQQILNDNGVKLSPTEADGEMNSSSSSNAEVKQMERLPLSEFSKDVLEDITEESERLLSLSTTIEEEREQEQEHVPPSLSPDESKRLLQQAAKRAEGSHSSLASLNMLKQLEANVQELHSQLEMKDNCLASLNLQMEAVRRESCAGPASARDSSSMMTNSTEYRTLQEEFGGPTLDMYLEVSRRDEMIAKLTESLQHSMNVRGELQADAERLGGEVQNLRRQLHEAIDAVKRSSAVWPDQECNPGQRISEISMDLMSESDDDLDRNFLTDNEERGSRSSKERQVPLHSLDDLGLQPLQPEWTPAFTKQIEQFQTYLLPHEQRLFLMVQRKFDDYLGQQLSIIREQCAQELKIARDQWESEKQSNQQSQQATHAREVEELRKYFEHKCADLEKQFSDDVFSHKSQHLAGDSSSECSEVDQLPEEAVTVAASSAKETSPRKRKRAELLLSPSHRQMTPCGLDSLGECRSSGRNDKEDISELKIFYQTHMQDIKRAHELTVRKLSDRIKFYERSQGDDDYKPAVESPPRTCPGAGAAEVEGSKSAAPNISLIIIDEDELNFNNESQVVQRIIEEYERRLQEQLALARQDIANELERQIQKLLSENAVDDQHWPKELILLREKFTAKSQLEITQLNIKHADEMSRLKLEYEKQLNRKNKRHLTFDSSRDLEQVINERDGLRELSKSFRSVLSRLAKCVANCEEDLNATLSEEVQRLLLHSHNHSQSRSQEVGEEFEQTLSSSLNNTRPLRLVPDVHSLLELVEDPSLVQFINSKSNEDNMEDFDLTDCLERLKSEATYLLQLSEDLHKQREHDSNDSLGEPEKQEHELCCEAEDGLKTTADVQQQLLSKFVRTNSLNDQQLGVANRRKNSSSEGEKTHTSLPHDLQQHAGNSSELSFQLVELKNRLIKSETDRQKLQQQLSNTIDRNAELGHELQALRDQLSQLNSLNHTDYNEGYGLGRMKSLHEQGLDQSSASFTALQDRARHLLSSSPGSQQDQLEQTRDSGNATVMLLQLIEDFCREGDKVVECSKKDREDLQSQIDTADKQLKDTRRFLEDQAAEREQERDDFQREIELLKSQLRDKEKECCSYANASEEYAQLEAQLRAANLQLSQSNDKKDRFEVELKASIDKIFVLREIISELETQVQTKSLNEHVLDEKTKQLEDYVSLQMSANDALQQEVHRLQKDIGEGYQSRIRLLEEKLQQGRPSAEQSLVLVQVAEKLRDIETTLEQKTKVLESLHNSNTTSNSASLSVTEDVSVHGGRSRPHTAVGSTSHSSLTVEGVERVTQKLDRHTRVEEAAIKRIRDLEMQLQQMRSGCVELQHERDSLQGRIDEQTLKISTLHTRLEEQRQRAEQLHRAGTSDLNTRVNELQGEVKNHIEQLAARDKQMATMRQQLQRSKGEITRLEAELTVLTKPDRTVVERLQVELQRKGDEICKLKEKIRTEMINRLAVPDLMETMLADKNDEIDHLRDQLEAKERELRVAHENASQNSSPAAGPAEKQEASAKLSARTLSDIGSITEFPEPDVDRRAAMLSLSAPLQMSDGAGGFLHQTMETSKEAVANLTYKRTDDLSGFTAPYPINTFEHPHYFQATGITAQRSDGLTPGLVPRQINFSNLTEDSKLKTPSLLMRTPEMPRPTTPGDVQQLQKKLTELERQKEQQQSEMEAKLSDLEKQMQQEKEQWIRHEKTLRGHEESEERYRLRIESLESRILETAAQEAAERQNLRMELNCVSAAHHQCEDAAAAGKRELEKLNSEVKKKAEQLQTALRRCADLELQVQTLERDLERLKNSENSSKQYSVDEIAQQVEKELNYSAQLDSSILKAIESEEENNLDNKQQQKEVQTEEEHSPGTGNGTDDENFTSERELLNQLEAFKTQLALERDQSEALSKELLSEKQHSQDIQEQDVVIIEAMRKRLETALDAEEELHKQLDQERERCERLQTQLTSLQRAESRRNSSLLLKSPGDSPRKSPRADFESELGERLRSEIKLLAAQNERERERSADAKRSSERERQRYEKELQERVAYCERLKQEMEKQARDKEAAEVELEHFNERLTLQASEIQSLEARLVTLQEAETRRANTRTRQHQENVNLHAEIYELKAKLLAAEAERDCLDQKVNHLRSDLGRSGHREAKLAEALAQANDRLAHSTDDTVPAQFLQKMKEINTLLAENTQENRQMAETVQCLVGERIALQKKCEELSGSGSGNVVELEERCRQLLGRYLRVESHRKALVYQKRYLKLTLEGYQASEQLALRTMAGDAQQRKSKNKFKTAALAIIAIQRIKYIGRIWLTGKRIMSKSVFTITQKRNAYGLNLNVPPVQSPLPVPNSNLPTNNIISERLGYAPISAPLVNFSTLQPIVLAPDYTLKEPAPSMPKNHNNESSLPSLARLDWNTMQKPRRAHVRHH
ncbi:A-kinase anchor protein 9 isoform X3 [Drosophila guanche]|uniref:A-kinase anchor protein 9 isoform X3 n=1 Tax=Drosophila guanche TaxID=7266 RepID=UPI001472543F|nr:A-kinase anchor protein 9 isoform X3 [Drosophila guanche]